MQEEESPRSSIDLQYDTDDHDQEPQSPFQLDENQLSDSPTSQESPPLSDAAHLSDSDSSCQFEGMPIASVATVILLYCLVYL